MKERKVVCLCEDISEDEIRDAIRLGFDDIETLKRYTGATTGPCQGKFCLLHLLRILAAEKGLKMDEMRITTARPPNRPVLIGALAGESK
ncbi:MAG: (2Fe-2S)-binding protein [Candidatus Bathyarchaeia archaeon]